MGNSKVFFKSGILASLEERRDEKVRARARLLNPCILHLVNAVAPYSLWVR